MDKYMRSTLESMEEVTSDKPRIYSRCIDFSGDAVSFDVEMRWLPDLAIAVRLFGYNRMKVNVVVTKSLETSLSYPFDQGRPLDEEKEKWLIEHCIERAKVIFK